MIQKYNIEFSICKSFEDCSFIFKTHNYADRISYINKPLYKAFLLKVNDKYVGMFRVCKTDKDMGELKSLYLLDEVKHKGYGKILFKRALEEVKKMGFNSMIVGCLSDNTNANNFYKHMGGVFVSNRDFTIPNQTLKENVYLFKI